MACHQEVDIRPGWHTHGRFAEFPIYRDRDTSNDFLTPPPDSDEASLHDLPGVIVRLATLFHDATRLQYCVAYSRTVRGRILPSRRCCNSQPLAFFSKL